MSAANAAPRSLRPNPRTLGLWAVLALLALFVGYAGLRELREVPADARALAAASAFADRRPALSAEEERFAQALWKIHADVRTAAVRMTFAGLAYKIGDGDRSSVNTKVVPLTAVFSQAASELRSLDAPASMRELHGRYAGALQLYGEASREMIKVAHDGDDAHLLRAQEMSERASGILLEVGEQFWPGEIKPN
jgi:hypothetical protein